MTPDLLNPIFTDETKAREWLEKRIWPDGPICPKCGTVGEATLMNGKSHRAGLYQCNACREPFTVTVGTLYERSHIPLNKWLAATHLMMASKKGMSALQISRMLGVGYKTAWFLCHRIRESLRETTPGRLGGKGKTVEIDESYVGGLEKNKHRSKRKHVGTGGAVKEAVPAVNAKTLRPILKAHLHGATMVMTDEGGAAKKVGSEFKRHQSVNHSIGEYVRGDAHTNTIEGYFSIMKRGIYGTFHHVSQQHLKRYLAEFDLRYNERTALGINDAARMSKSIGGIVGKRLTYRRPDSAAHA